MTSHTPDKPRKRWRASAAVQVRARQLRREMTPAEARLWRHLQNRQLNGAYFRKQHTVGRFIVDFFCAMSKLVVEVDGDSHAVQTDYDEARSQWFREQKNYRVIRVTNDDVHHNIEGVLDIISKALRA